MVKKAILRDDDTKKLLVPQSARRKSKAVVAIDKPKS
jgi:hypothetical protein